MIILIGSLNMLKNINNYKMHDFKDVIFVSVCFSDPRYFEQQERLKKSILKFYPEANLLFFRGSYPEGSKSFSDSLYGFKCHAIAQAKKQFSKIIWIDTAMVMTDYIDQILKFDVLAVKDDNPLYPVMSDRCYNYFGETKAEVMRKEWHLVGGSLLYFDFEKESANLIFNSWMEAEKAGIFGNQAEEASEQLQGHRHDEAVLALCMYYNGVEPSSAEDARYCWVENPMFTKNHFK